MVSKSGLALEALLRGPDDLLLLVGNRNPLKAKQNLYFKSKAYRGRFDQNPLH